MIALSNYIGIFVGAIPLAVPLVAAALGGIAVFALAALAILCHKCCLLMIRFYKEDLCFLLRICELLS